MAVGVVIKVPFEQANQRKDLNEIKNMKGKEAKGEGK